MAPRSVYFEPGGALVHPVPLVAIAVLVVNDHVLKGRAPGLVTGKLSDFAGLVFFPLLLEALVEGARTLAGRFRGPSRALGLACVGLTGCGFAWVKTTHLGVETYGLVLGLLQSPFRAVAHAFGFGAGPAFVPAGIVRDPSDLAACLALVVPAFLCAARARGPSVVP